MSGARFYETSQGKAALQRLQQLPSAADRGVSKGLSAWALAVKREAARQIPGRSVRGFGYDPVRKRDSRWQVKFNLRYLAAWWEIGTRAHRILPRGTGRARIVGREHRIGRANKSRSKVLVVPPAAGTRSPYSTSRGGGGGKEGLRRWVAHPGTKKHWTVRKTITERSAAGGQVINEHVLRELRR